VRGLESFVDELARERGVDASLNRRLQMPATPMSDRIVEALDSAAERSGELYMSMPSGAVHDTMCVADHVPTGMVFVPCKDGISHAPEESAEPADAAVAAEVMLNAIVELT
jgi:acetylornithine deacetylase/succinyl-diaminopimelate desuccinylase-like protein